MEALRSSHCSNIARPSHTSRFVPRNARRAPRSQNSRQVLRTITHMSMPSAVEGETDPQGLISSRLECDVGLWNEASAAVFSRDAETASPGTPRVLKKAMQLRAHELSTATAGFNPKYLIASGTFGQVFAATLPSLPGAGVCAIKRVTADCGEDVSAEVELLSKAAHANLLPLLGFSHGHEACLVFPLMRGGTLEDRVIRTPAGEERLSALGQSSPPLPLAWWERVRILRDATRGLVYLHTICQTLHSDVKPSNILLDKRLNARLADFGLAAALQPSSLKGAKGVAGRGGSEGRWGI